MSATRKRRRAAFTPLQRPDADGGGNIPKPPVVATMKRPEDRAPKITDPEDFEFAPFNQRGGFGKAHQLFGDKLPALLDELNLVLAA